MRRISRKPRFSRFRRFRRNRGTWFPTLGNTLSFDGLDYQIASWSDSTADVLDSRAEGPQAITFPITKDFTQFSDTSSSLDGPSLRDVVEGATWRVNRVVGELHLDVTEINTAVGNTTWPCLQIGAGFYVARAQEFDQSLPDLTFDEFDPFAKRNIQNSWLWRRTWILSRPLASNVGFTAIPCSNNNMGPDSGPHIDIRVKRKILREHRLWFVVACMGWNGSDIVMTPDEGVRQPKLRFNLDLRVHGQMQRGRPSAAF